MLLYILKQRRGSSRVIIAPRGLTGACHNSPTTREMQRLPVPATQRVSFLYPRRLGMCILFAAIKQHATFPLIVATNRDEYISRETLPASTNLFDQGKHVFGGKDVRGGGTWLGIDTMRGRFSCVLNVASIEKPAKNSPSRGLLPLNYLLANNEATPAQMVEDVLNEGDKYAGFTLVCADKRNGAEPRLVLGTNSHLQTKDHCKLWNISNKCGLYGLTNDGNLFHRHSSNSSMAHTKDSRGNPKQSHWNKVTRGCKIFEDVLSTNFSNQGEDITETIAEALLESLLHDKVTDETRNHGSNPIFLPWAPYCTRTSQVVLFHQDGSIHFFSRNYVNEKDYEAKYEKILPQVISDDHGESDQGSAML